MLLERLGTPDSLARRVAGRDRALSRAYRYLSGSIRAHREAERLDAPAVRIEVRVELKAGVLDAEAESIEKSLALLGIPSVKRVTTARIYDLEFTNVAEEEARHFRILRDRLADRAVERLLANPVIHRVSVRPLRD
jgi:phosphoribosylformylglycinamidine synthase PurS subunit